MSASRRVELPFCWFVPNLSDRTLLFAIDLSIRKMITCLKNSNKAFDIALKWRQAQK
jgi:hypothetical protein